MVVDRKAKLIKRFVADQQDAGVAGSDGWLVCPLCWMPKPLDGFSLEHIVPKAIGGRRTTLTCTTCNNNHGNELDSHLVKYQTVRDALEGRAFIPGRMDLNGQNVAVRFQSDQGGERKHIHIVKRASDPKHAEGIQSDFRNGSVDEINLKLYFGFSKNRMQTALLRIGYLALFHRFGYRYAKNPLVQTVRERILNPADQTFRLASFVAAVRKCSLPFDEPYFIITGDLDKMPFFQVIIRSRAMTTTYHSIALPGLGLEDPEFFHAFQAFTTRNRQFAINGLTANDTLGR